MDELAKLLEENKETDFISKKLQAWIVHSMDRHAKVEYGHAGAVRRGFQFQRREHTPERVPAAMRNKATPVK